MTALRAVRPNRACEARSSSPMYASTSTIRPARRTASAGPCESRDQHGAEQGAGGLERRSGEEPARSNVSGGRRKASARRERVANVLREQEAEDAQDAPGSRCAGGCPR